MGQCRIKRGLSQCIWKTSSDIYNNIKRSRGGNNLVETRRGKAGLAKIAEEEAEEDGEPLWPIDAPGEDDDID